MSFRIAFTTAAVLLLTACSTVPQENCLEQLASIPKLEDGTIPMDPNDARVFGFHSCMARQGHKPAMLWLGEQYEKGSQLVTADQEKAFEFYLQAATDDPTRTSIYVPGIEGRAGTVMSFENHRATQGLAEAQYRVGLMYNEGRGVRQSRKLAVKWMRKAAKRGHKGAKRWLNPPMEDDYFPTHRRPEPDSPSEPIRIDEFESSDLCNTQVENCEETHSEE